MIIERKERRNRGRVFQEGKERSEKVESALRKRRKVECSRMFPGDEISYWRPFVKGKKKWEEWSQDDAFSSGDSEDDASQQRRRFPFQSVVGIQMTTLPNKDDASLSSQ